MLSKFRKGRKGFTLIELMIVVAIIGILAAIAIPQYANLRKKGMHASAKSALTNLARAQDLYYNKQVESGAVGTYTMLPADLVSWYTPEAQVTVVITEGNTDTWFATAVHNGDPGTIFQYDYDGGGLSQQ
jgi:prepilin-type N-terminal cleavage/methylation domain-containing protein